VGVWRSIGFSIRARRHAPDAAPGSRGHRNEAGVPIYVAMVKQKAQRVLKALPGRFADAATSGAGKAMLLATVLLAGLVLFNHDLDRALVSGGILYAILLTSLVVRRGPGAKSSSDLD
jgi:hypothetical protein